MKASPGGLRPQSNTIWRYHRRVPMSEAVELTSVELAAKLFRGLADPTRLSVLLARRAESGG